MTLVSNDPSWWPTIDSYRFYSYFAVAASAAVVYDWALTLEQEVEMVWRQRWSLMTVLYLGIRYIGIPYAVMFLLVSLPTVSVTDAVSNIMSSALNWTTVIVTAMLGAVMIARLHAMYHGSRKMLIFLVVIVLAVNIACGVITAEVNRKVSREELILSSTYQCSANVEGNIELLIAMTWTLTTVWEVLALCLSLWIAVKHFRDLRRLQRSTIGDCFTVLVKSHVVYFASFAAISCLQLGFLSPVIADSDSVGAEIYDSLVEILLLVQMFVVGPRLILSVREYHAKLVADSDAATCMTSIAFQERVHVSTSSSV